MVQILFDDYLNFSPITFHVLDFISTSFKPDNFIGAMYRVFGLRLGPKFEVGPATEKNLYLLLPVEKHTFAVLFQKNYNLISGINFTAVAKFINQTQC